MNKVILVISSGLLAVAFPVVTHAAGQQQQQQQSVSTSVTASNSVAFGGFDGFGFGSCNFCAGDGFGGGISQNVDVDTNVNQQQQQQQQDNNGGSTNNGGQQQQQQDQNGQKQQQQQGGNEQSQQQSKNGQSQQQKQVAAVTTVPTTKTGKLPNAGADVALPGSLASLGVSFAAYLKQKKQMAALSFLG